MGKYSKEELIESINRLDRLAAQVKLSRQEHLIIGADIKKLRESLDCPCKESTLKKLEE